MLFWLRCFRFVHILVCFSYLMNFFRGIHVTVVNSVIGEISKKRYIYFWQLRCLRRGGEYPHGNISK